MNVSVVNGNKRFRSKRFRRFWSIFRFLNARKLGRAQKSARRGRGRRGVFQNHGLCWQAFPFLASPPLSLPAPSISVALTPIFAYPASSGSRRTRVIFAQPKSEKCLERAEKPTETLATQANVPYPWNVGDVMRPARRSEDGRKINV